MQGDRQPNGPRTVPVKSGKSSVLRNPFVPGSQDSWSPQPVAWAQEGMRDKTRAPGAETGAGALLGARSPPPRAPRGALRLRNQASPVTKYSHSRPKSAPLSQYHQCGARLSTCSPVLFPSLPSYVLGLQASEPHLSCTRQTCILTPVSRLGQGARFPRPVPWGGPAVPSAGTRWGTACPCAWEARPPSPTLSGSWRTLPASPPGKSTD